MAEQAQSPAVSSAPVPALSPLTAAGPVDGRYAGRTAPLRAITSEFALIRYRVQVELEWFRTLANHPQVDALPALDAASDAHLDQVLAAFSIDDAQRVKNHEAVTNHDVKAVEYFVKERLGELPQLQPHLEFVHFACTSEDINNLAYALMLRDARDLLSGRLNAVLDAVATLSGAFGDQPMLARTHGQPASPTTLGKELENVRARLRRQWHRANSVEILGKLNGATGNFNAHVAAWPNLDWPTISADCIRKLGLIPNPMTTQIEPHDWIGEYCDALAAVNRVLLDLDRDVWGYIAIDYFGQRKVEGETGSSTMPHKVNPIDFENSEGNIGIANALLTHLAEKLPISRWQRDLSDSTVLRSLGTALGHTLIAWESTIKGLGKLTVNQARMGADLDDNWEVLGEAVQTVMRRAGMDQPYEKLKAATRGQRLNRERYLEMLNTLELPEALQAQLRDLTPASYTGLAASLAQSHREDS